MEQQIPKLRPGLLVQAHNFAIEHCLRFACNAEIECDLKRSSGASRPLSFVGRMFREVTIATRSDPQQSNEGAPHHIDVGESSSPSHLLEAVLGTFEFTTRCLHAGLEHILRRCRADLSSEYTLEVPHTHRHAIGKILY